MIGNKIRRFFKENHIISKLEENIITFSSIVLNLATVILLDSGERCQINIYEVYLRYILTFITIFLYFSKRYFCYGKANKVWEKLFHVNMSIILIMIPIYNMLLSHYDIVEILDVILGIIIFLIQFRYLNIPLLCCGYLFVVFCYETTCNVYPLLYECFNNQHIAVSVIIKTFIISLFIHLRYAITNLQTRETQLFIGAITHTVVGPLTTCNAGIQILQKTIYDNLKTNTKALFDETIDITVKAKSNIFLLLNNVKQNIILCENPEIQSFKQVMEDLLDEHLSPSEKRFLTLKIKNDVKFIGSKRLMGLVMLNLIRNSFQHGGKNVKVEVTTENHKIIVTDNGRGVLREYHPFLFQKFSTCYNGYGLGLGLYFCKEYVQAIGGEIECISQENLHTTFIIMLPKL